MSPFDPSGINLNVGEVQMLQRLFAAGGDYPAFIADLRRQVQDNDRGIVQRGGVEQELTRLQTAVMTIMRWSWQ